MTRIPAANNLTIEIDVTHWRLLAAPDNPIDDDNAAETLRSGASAVMLQAAMGDTLRYEAQFGQQHQLPASGSITPEQIQRVVLGWSNSDSLWHLGIMLTPELAAPRGSRWCEIARWNEAEAGLPGGAAAQAGMALAYMLGRSFNLVPPRTPAAPLNGSAPQTTTQVAFGAGATRRAPQVSPVTRPTPAYLSEPPTETPTLEAVAPVPPAPERTLPIPQLPFKTGMWLLERDPDGVLRYRRSPAWMWQRLWRAVWYAFWVAIYILLSYATLNSTLALPNAGTMLPSPEILPYLGIGSAALLLGLVLYILIDMILSPGLVVIDPYTRTIRMQRRDQTVWSKSANDLQAVYVSHVVNLKERKKRGGIEHQLEIQHGELNLHSGEKKFQRFLRVEETEEMQVDAYVATIAAHNSVWPLLPENVVTPMQGAALTIAQTLGLPCYYDQRTK
ncbi:MAG: hypothetical protein HXY40_14815 [Chloroflexi bacterium]|nr:hypothetical protein [Chloroflexota bacterium]